MRQYTGQIFRYAIATGRAEIDPSQPIVEALKTKKVEHQKSMPLEELPNFLSKINSNEARLFKQTCLALKLMVLTFTRKTELAHAKWSEINLQDKLWTIPADRMKMQKPHTVPLSKQVLAIFEELKAMNGDWEYVFTSQIAANPTDEPGYTAPSFIQAWIQRKGNNSRFQSARNDSNSGKP